MLSKLVSRVAGAFGRSGFEGYRGYMLAQGDASGPREKEALRDFTKAIRWQAGFPF